jgi:hypothetical protein
MRKMQTLSTALIAVFMLSGIAASIATAAEWLKNGEAVTKAEAATTDANIIIIHKGGSLGTAKIECSIKLTGTVSPEGKDEAKLVESLTGEQDLIGNCKVVEGFCLGAVVHAIELPWATKLEEVSEKIWDKTNFGYNVLCSFGIQVACSAISEKALFERNGANGAEFSYRGEESGKITCSDGGESALESPTRMTVLGFASTGTPTLHNEWLREGKVLTKSENATTDAKIMLVHNGGTLGKAKMECDVKLLGTVSPEGKDETTLIESLTVGQDLIGNCKPIEGFCSIPETHATKLPWTTQLEPISGKTWDKTKFGYSVLCSSGVQIECAATSIRTLFEGNGANGAEFSYKGTESGKITCSNGGEGRIESPTRAVVLGFTTSGGISHPEWLKGGEGLTHAQSATTEGTVIIFQTGGVFGNAKMECDIKLIGTVGPGSEDQTTLVESLTGERDLIGNCKNIEGLCVGAVIHPIKLPWTTKLEEISGKTWDKTKFDYNVLCSVSTQVECTTATSIKALLEKNGASGAEFAYKGAESGKMTCTDGGESTLESPENMVVLGFTVA